VTAARAAEPKRLHLLLAPKERFEAAGAGAFALNALETSLASRWRATITVFGAPVAEPFPGIRFRAITPDLWPFPDRNVAMARNYARAVKQSPPHLVEIYNRPVMVAPLKRRLGSVPIMLHFGNDPRGMDGSRSIAERRVLLANCAAIVCVSYFIRRCFLDGFFDATQSRVHVIHTGVEAAATFPAPKQNTIVYVGRIVPEKGTLELVQALARVLPRHPEWSAEILGARWFRNEKCLTEYERDVVAAAGDSACICLRGFRPHDKVIEMLRTASIAVVPSLWDDPFPRTALEALGQGCALVCSRRGGMGEIGAERARFLETITAGALAEVLEELIGSETERQALQRRGWEDFPFEIHRTARQLDDLRAGLMGAA
jgi:glycosyltransferase involved in cell wall biosynthesis